MTEHRNDWSSGRLAGELLGAGRRERASAGARERAAQTLLAGMMAPSAVAASPSTSTVGLKWLGISVLLALGGGLGLVAVGRADHGERPARLSHPSARATQEVLADSARSTSALVTPSLAAPVTSAPSRRGAMPSGAMPSGAIPSGAIQNGAAVPSASHSAAPTVRGEGDARLAQELLALKRARAAVAAGIPEQALSTLDGVAGGFQVLPLEAGLVRIEALRGAGERDAARALSEQLLREHPDGPYTERLRSVAAALGSRAPQPLPHSGTGAR